MRCAWKQLVFKYMINKAYMHGKVDILKYRKSRKEVLCGIIELWP